MKTRMMAILLALCLIFAMVPTVAAASDEAQQAAQTLYDMGLFNGTGTDSAGNPIFSLDAVPIREQAVTMLVRLLGKDSAATGGKWSVPFTDVSAWAKPYVGYAYANSLTTGMTATAFGGSQDATPAQYITFVLRALGYSSGSDFRWDAPWELSDKLGLTDGRYNAQTKAFTRGDVAIISKNALDICLKDSSTLLRDTLPEKQPASPSVPAPVQTTATRDTYLKRVLTDAQLAALKDADKDQLRASISTISDAVAYLDQFNAKFWTGDGRNNLTADHALHQIREESTATANVYTGFAGWCLSDDYPNVQFVTMYVEQEYRMCAALALPINGGWLILSPTTTSVAAGGSHYTLTEIDEVQVTALENLQKVLVASDFEEEPILSIFLGAVGQDLIFQWEGIALLSGNAREVYTMTETERNKANARKREERWERLMANWSGFGMPASQKPTMSRAQIEALLGKDIDTVAAAVKNIGDCMAYLCLSLFEASGGDIQFEVGNTGLSWHFNYSPQATFAYNWGDCGATSGLAAYLLEGDYDITGIVGMTFGEGEGGGHVINYVKDGNSYYMFDMVNLVSSNFRAHGFNFAKDSTLQKVCKKWSDETGWNEKLMWAYQAFDGDAPVGWDNTHVSYLPSSYQDTAVILMEHPNEGYIYKWVDLNPYVQMAITGLRNIY